jgi:hypothetical protein
VARVEEKAEPAGALSGAAGWPRQPWLDGRGRRGAPRAAARRAADGRVSPAAAAKAPAVPQRPVSIAYNAQAASAVNSDSV